MNQDQNNNIENESNYDRILLNPIVEEMKLSYLDYSMSVIVSRALPDVRDGLKPVHRRVLFGMHELGMGAGRAYKKSARLVGEVLGKYHPHGDSAVYDSMVRMAQHFSMRYTLVDGQGNFGSIDGDAAAAMRYTEVRMRRLSEEMLRDLEKETVDYSPNFDDTLEEPRVLPAAIPNLLINGASGIAVGMATNIPPHNLTEVINAIVAFIDKPEMDIDDLMTFIKGPDFPTGGLIYGFSGVNAAYKTGRGRVVMRARAHFETKPNGRESIIFTEIPFQTNKASIIEKIADLVRDKRIEGISDIRDESDRDGLRMVIELKKDALPSIVLNQLYKYTQLQNTFGVIMIALVNGIPRLLNLREMVSYYVDHRMEVVTRRHQFDLKEAEHKAHILEGLKIALDNIDEIIKTIRASDDAATAQQNLISTFGLSEIQSKAILDMRLQRLTGLERDKVEQDLKETLAKIDELREILASESKRYEIIKTELLEIKEKYGDARKTELVHAEDDIDIEDLIADDSVIVTISHQGYIKRVPVTEFRSQGRGGKGVTGASLGDEDFVEHMFTATNHNTIMFFTNLGRVYWLKVYAVPESSRTSKGRSIANLLEFQEGENIASYIPVKSFDHDGYILMATKNGIVKKTHLKFYSNIRRGGINAITIRENDELIGVNLTNGNFTVILGTNSGKSIRFNESDVREMGRTATGVIGIRVSETERVVGMVATDQTDVSLLVATETGMGKRSNLEEYRIQGRGGKGIITLRVTEKTGKMVAIKQVNDDKDLIIITANGTIIRQPCSELREMGRYTQGVRLIRLKEGDSIAAIEITNIQIEKDELDVDNQTQSDLPAL